MADLSQSNSNELKLKAINIRMKHNQDTLSTSGQSKDLSTEDMVACMRLLQDARDKADQGNLEDAEQLLGSAEQLIAVVKPSSTPGSVRSRSLTITFAFTIALVALSLGYYGYQTFQIKSELPQVESHAKDYSEKSNDGIDKIIKKNHLKKLEAEEIFNRVSPGIVQINILDENCKTLGSGTGFCVSVSLKPMYSIVIATNYHVIRPAVYLEYLTIDGKKIGSPAKVIKGKDFIFSKILAEDKTGDLALIKVSGYYNNHLKNISVLKLGSHKPPIGSKVFAIGNPKGLINSLSDGLVSGYRPRKGNVEWLQTTAPISPGSSGGPLIDEFGRVVGITTSGIINGQNLNFAIPVDALKRLIKGPKSSRNVGEGAHLDGAVSSGFLNLILPEIDPETGKPNAIPKQYHLLFKSYQRLNEFYFRDADKLLKEAQKSKLHQYYYLVEYMNGQIFSQIGDGEVRVAIKENANLAKSMRANSNFMIAMSSFQKSIKSKPSFAPSHYYLADILFEMQYYERSAKTLSNFIGLMPRCWQGYFLRGRVYAGMGRLQDALDDYKTATSFRSNDARIFFRKASVYEDAEEYEAAIDSLKTAIGLGFEGKALCYYNIGDCYKKMGKFRRAIAAYQKANEFKSFPESWVKTRIDECVRRIR